MTFRDHLRTYVQFRQYCCQLRSILSEPNHRVNNYKGLTINIFQPTLTSRPTYIVCRGLRPLRLTSTAQLPHHDLPTCRRLPPDLSLSPFGLAGCRPTSRCPLPKSDKSAIIRRHVGDWFYDEGYRPTTVSTLSRPVHAEAWRTTSFTWGRQYRPRHHDLRLQGRKRRPTGRFDGTAAPTGASIFRSG